MSSWGDEEKIPDSKRLWFAKPRKRFCSYDGVKQRMSASDGTIDMAVQGCISRTELTRPHPYNSISFISWPLKGVAQLMRLNHECIMQL